MKLSTSSRPSVEISTPRSPRRRRREQSRMTAADQRSRAEKAQQSVEGCVALETAIRDVRNEVVNSSLAALRARRPHRFAFVLGAGSVIDLGDDGTKPNDRNRPAMGELFRSQFFPRDSARSSSPGSLRQLPRAIGRACRAADPAPRGGSDRPREPPGAPQDSRRSQDWPHRRRVADPRRHGRQRCATISRPRLASKPSCSRPRRRAPVEF